MPRDFVFDGILLGSSRAKEKDSLLSFITADAGMIRVFDYGAAEGGGKSFPLYCGGSIYLYKAETSSVYTLRDSLIKDNRTVLLCSANSLYMPAFVDCIRYFSSFDNAFVYGLAKDVFDCACTLTDMRKLFVFFVERLFANCIGSQSYVSCPDCGRQFADEEPVGYGTALNAPACNQCADVRDVLFPGMRRCLRYCADTDMLAFCQTEISPAALKRIVGFELFRLGSISATLFANCRLIDFDINSKPH